MCLLHDLSIPQGWTLVASVLIADVTVDLVCKWNSLPKYERLRVIMAMQIGAVKVIIR